MVDLSPYPTRIDKPFQDIEEWFRPVIERGRDAVFIDTGFIRALLIDEGGRTEIAKYFLEATPANFYTTDLVLAEVVRQVVKSKGDTTSREQQFKECSELLINTSVIFVCAPPREVVLQAYDELVEARQTEPKLDLCDMLSIVVLDYAMHRRVFGLVVGCDYLYPLLG
jgi:predicted nucleic acid-binding protein